MTPYNSASPVDQTTYIVVSGMLNNTSRVIGLLRQILPTGTILAVDYSNTGFHPDRFAKKLQHYLSAIPPTQKVAIIATCQGAHPGILVANSLNIPIVSISPYMSTKAIRPTKRWGMIKKVSTVGIPIKYLLGWASCLPVYKFDRDLYSLSTFVDQCYWSFRPTTIVPHDRAALIISEPDEYLLNRIVMANYRSHVIKTVDSPHANLSYPVLQEAIRDALNTILS